MNKIKQLCLILWFSFLYSVAIGGILSPNNIAPGGLSGVAIVLNHISSIPIGVLIFLFNIPLLIISYLKLGPGFFLKTILTVLLTSVFIDIFSYIDMQNYSSGLYFTEQVSLRSTAMPSNIITTNPLLAALIGGFFLGYSIAHLFKLGSTTGGTDIIVRLLKLRHQHIDTGRLFLILDFIIIAFSIFAFKSLETGMYALVTVYVSSFSLDKALYKTDKAILIMAISSVSDRIASSLVLDLDIGATLLYGKGCYSEQSINAILCVLRKQQYPKVKKLIFSIDPNAFVIVTSANCVLGAGFKDHRQLPL